MAVSHCVLLAGILLAAGPGRAWSPRSSPAVPRLDAALERVGTDGATIHASTQDLGAVTKPSERLGALLYRLSPISLSDGQRRALRLQDKPIAEFYADKAVMMIIGAVLPGLAAFALVSDRVVPRPLAGAPVPGRCGDRVLRARPAAPPRRRHRPLGSGRGPARLHRPGHPGAPGQRLGHPGAAQRGAAQRQSAVPADPHRTGARTTGAAAARTTSCAASPTSCSCPS